MSYLTIFVPQIYTMTKIDIVANISRDTGIDRVDVKEIIEKFMFEVTGSLERGENVYLRGFGSFIVRKRKAKLARNIKKGTPVVVPECYVPYFKPAREVVDSVKSKVKSI